MTYNRLYSKTSVLYAALFFGNFSCAMDATQECSATEQERAVILCDVRENLARIIACEEIQDEDRSEGEKLKPYLQSLQSELANDVPLAQNAVIATVAVGSTLLFYNKDSRQLTYLYSVREPVQHLSLDESGALHVLFSSGEKSVWQKRMPRTSISENIFDEIDTQK